MNQSLGWLESALNTALMSLSFIFDIEKTFAILTIFNLEWR